jgi:D-alanine-D-alanine ligase
MKIVVLAGGLSHEREVSERSGRRVADALRGRGHEVEVLDTDLTLLNKLTEANPDVVIPMIHGAAGEDGSLREILDALGFAYVGAEPQSCRNTFDKPIAKAILESAGIAVPAGVALPHSLFRELGADQVIRALVAKLGMPLMVKPARGGSALGASVVHEAHHLPSALVAAFAYGEVTMIEQFIEGTEVAVGVIETAVGPSALPAVEIRPDSGVYDYTARYTAGFTEFFCPARISDEISARVAETAVTAHLALNLRDLSRSDMIVDGNGGVWFLEANVAPGMTETSLYPQALEAAGTDLGEVLETLALQAMNRKK